MSGNASLLKKHGLAALKVEWTDNARDKGSCWGRNITDGTLTTQPNGRPCHMIRKPNFEDRTADVSIDFFQAVVGNEKPGDEPLKHIPLRTFLDKISEYVPGVESSVLAAEKDTHVLATSQLCLIEDDNGTGVDFSYNLYNYQSTDKLPCLLVITVSAIGTSVQVCGSGTTKVCFSACCLHYRTQCLYDDNNNFMLILCLLFNLHFSCCSTIAPKRRVITMWTEIV
jgi:hypothetical protein